MIPILLLKRWVLESFALYSIYYWKSGYLSGFMSEIAFRWFYIYTLIPNLEFGETLLEISLIEDVLSTEWDSPFYLFLGLGDKL